MATFPRSGSVQLAGISEIVLTTALMTFFLYSYWLSGSSGCFKSHNGRRLATTGTEAKLYAGGGELTDHSSVQASQGSLPALSPFQYDRIRFATNTRTPAAWMKAPIETIRLIASQPRPGS